MSLFSDYLLPIAVTEALNSNIYCSGNYILYIAKSLVCIIPACRRQVDVSDCVGVWRRYHVGHVSLYLSTDR